MIGRFKKRGWAISGTVWASALDGVIRFHGSPALRELVFDKQGGSGVHVVIPVLAASHPLGFRYSRYASSESSVKNRLPDPLRTPS